MRQSSKYVISGIGAGALVLSVLSDAMASHPAPLRNQAVSRSTQVVNGSLEVKKVLRVDQNNSVYGKLYAHGGAQAWKGLLIHDGGVTVNNGGLTVASGGVSTDSLKVVNNGAIDAGSATFTQNLSSGTLQTGAISGATLNLTGAASVGGTLTTAGKLTANGIDAGTGGITTTGNISTGGLNITGAGLSTSSITDSGSLTARDITASGTFTAANSSLANVTVSGNVDFTRANVTGLTLSNLGLNGNVGSLTIGNASGTTSPLTVSENGRTSAIGVNSSGALTTGDLTSNGNLSAAGTLTVGSSALVSGNLQVSGSNGITTAGISGTPAANTNTPGTLTLAGSSITLNGNTTHNGSLTLAGGNDLFLSAVAATSTTNASYSHLSAQGDTDVAGTLTVTCTAGTNSPSTPCTNTYFFKKSYSTLPIVTISATTDPAPAGSAGSPRVFVTPTSAAGSGSWQSFTINYIPGAAPTGNFQVTYNYHVIGS